ncbi:hypothetical protein DVH24_033576 [Malus domestica]|uniref:Myosin motor domain-containing protein n=1 Tax=Malus domestica TaxID=3750 RepID=A0A498JB31_MALDO|nr:hypothetical protein DVH24_033576 [Malus domestica]
MRDSGLQAVGLKKQKGRFDDGVGVVAELEDQRQQLRGLDQTSNIILRDLPADGSRAVEFVRDLLHQAAANDPYSGGHLWVRLNVKRASEYKYLNQSDCLEIDGVGSADVVQVCKEDQEHMLSLLAAVLWLGNISFQAIDNEKHVEVLADEGNCCKKVGKCCTGRSISILGIYGFESFQNGFEQMCINYANERLQQHLNRQLHKLEQEECELDGVDWTKVDFQDNQECLNLFEKTSLSVARRSFASDNTAGQPGRLGSVSSPCYDSEEATSLGPGTPGASTPFNGAGCQANGSSNAVSNLLREFEQ